MKRSFLPILILSLLVCTTCNRGGEAAEAPSEPAVEEGVVEEILYSLTVDVYPEEGGLVYPAEAEVPAGEMIEVEAVPVPGYEFEGWSGASSISAPNLSLTMDGDRQLTAHFIILPTPTQEPAKLPGQITTEDEGETKQICGVVTSFNTEPIFLKAYSIGEFIDVYSFIKLDGQFLVASRDWIFEAGWVGAGLCLEDEVELIEGFPGFLVDHEEGKAGVECTIENVQCGWNGDNGNIPVYCEQTRCPAGDYFRPCEFCQDAHFNLPDLTDLPTREMQINSGLAPQTW